MSQTKAQLIDPVDGTIVNADINASAAIDGSKITPTFTSTVNVTNTLPEIFLTDTNTSNARGRLNANGGGLLLGADNDNAAADSVISFAVDGSERARINSSGHLLFAGTSEEITLQTSDGSDDGYLNLSGGGACSQNRGAQLVLCGNERSGLLGTCQVMAGNAGSASSVIQFFTGGSEQARVDASGRVLIGTTTEGNSSADDLTVAGSGNTGITIRSGTANQGAIYFSDATSGNEEFDGFVGYAQNNQQLFFGTATSTRLRIDSTGRISAGKHGLGTHNDASEYFKVQSDDTSANISIVGSNDTHSTLNMGDEDDFNIQKIKSDHTNNSLQFFTVDAERMRIDSSGTINSFSTNDTTPNIKWRSDDTNWFGSLNQSVEGATISTFLSVGGDWTASGTTYSATKALASFETRAIVLHNQFNNGAGKVAFLQKAGGSSTTDGTVTEILKIDNDGIKFGTDTAVKNALNDYEEGQYTPTLSRSGSSITYTYNNGRYIRVGNLCFVWFDIQTSGNNSTGSGTYKVSLPFTFADNSTGSSGLNNAGHGAPSFRDMSFFTRDQGYKTSSFIQGAEIQLKYINSSNNEQNMIENGSNGRVTGQAWVI